MKSAIGILLFVALYSFAAMGEVNILIEGPDKEMFYGDVVELKLTLWPIESKEKYKDLLEKDIFVGSIKVLSIEGLGISENNSEALVITFLGAVLNSELPEEVEIEGVSTVLMKRTMSISEFHPEAEEIIIFDQKVSMKEQAHALYYFIIFCIVFVLILFIQKLLQSKRFRAAQKRKHLEFSGSLKSMKVLELTNFLYKNEDVWLKYYDKAKWISLKSELNKYVYKKSLSDEETMLVEKSLKEILEEIDKWSL